MAQTTESVVDLLRGASHDLEHRQRQGATRPAERGGVAIHDLELSTVVDPSTASRDACGLVAPAHLEPGLDQRDDLVVELVDAGPAARNDRGCLFLGQGHRRLVGAVDTHVRDPLSAGTWGGRWSAP